MFLRVAFAMVFWPGLALAQLHTSLLLPVDAACISSPFGPRILPNHPQAGTFHYGVDLPAPEGAAVRATAAGRIIRIQEKGPGGLEMLVQHAGYVGVYSHLGLITPALVAGKAVLAGETLGVVGHTGVTFGMHLYFEMITGHPIDPAPYLRVPLCNGVIPHQRTMREILQAGDRLPPSKPYLHYLQYLHTEITQ
jgi:murein DD-endopeptidase MepM/ murein hydrolase activator NlpD